MKTLLPSHWVRRISLAILLPASGYIGLRIIELYRLGIYGVEARATLVNKYIAIHEGLTEGMLIYKYSVGSASLEGSEPADMRLYDRLNPGDTFIVRYLPAFPSVSQPWAGRNRNRVLWHVVLFVAGLAYSVRLLREEMFGRLEPLEQRRELGRQRR